MRREAVERWHSAGSRSCRGAGTSSHALSIHGPSDITFYPVGTKCQRVYTTRLTVQVAVTTVGGCSVRERCILRWLVLSQLLIRNSRNV